MSGPDAVMVISTGVQDLKVVCCQEENGGSVIVLREMDRANRRKLHEGLYSGEIPCRIVASEAELAFLYPGTAIDLKKNRGRLKIVINPGGKPVFADDHHNGVSTRAIQKCGKWLLYPAKLHTVVKAVQSHYNIDGALLFYTNRKRCKQFQRDYEQEPVAAGKLLAQWLAGLVSSTAREDEGADFRQAAFCHVNYLKREVALEGDDVALYGNPAPYSQPLALSAISEVDNSLKKLSERFPGCTAVVSHTGGPGDIKSVITAAARLHFGGQIIELHDNKYVSFNSDPLAKPALFRIPPRNAALDARHHAALRLWEGDFAGAWAVASHIKKNDPGLACDPWVKNIWDAAKWMQGWGEPEELNPFESLPEDRGLEKLFILAWRVEAALQNNHGQPLITDVLRHLGTFREKLLEYCLLLVLKELGCTVDLANWKVEARSRQCRDKRINIKGGYLDTRNMGKLAAFFYDCKEKRQDLYQAYYPFSVLLERDIHKECVDITSNPRDCLRAYRNQLTHNILPPEAIEAIEQYGNQRQLWNTKPNEQRRDQLGGCFLAMPAIQQIFAVISPGCSPEAEYRRFVNRLLDVIHAPMSRDCVP